MADLENLLLEAAGRNRHAPPPSGRGGDSDGGSDSGDDDDSDDEIVQGYPAARKHSAAQVPLKKRIDSTDRKDGGDDDGGDDSGESSDDDSDIGDDLYKNEGDRQKLAEMTELQREMILSDRATKKNDKGLLVKISLKRDNMGKTRSASRNQTPPPSLSSGRSADRSAAKDDALNELRAKRSRRQGPEAQDTVREVSRSSGLSTKPKPFSLSGPGHSESEGSSDSDDEVLAGHRGIIDNNDDRIGGPSFEDIKEITIPRSKLAKWFMEPFFEELIVGCFVRVGIGRSKSGPIYRLCMVKNVDASDPDRQYKFENKSTYKYLNVVWGNETSAARWQMAMVSDSPPLEEEFEQWLKEVERNAGHMLMKQDVLEKKEAIQKINSFVYSAATVKQMLQEKKSASSRRINVAAEKDRLRREMELAQSNHDEATVERIKTRLEELEASRQAQDKDSKALRLSEMNKKNRFENFKNASQLKRTNTDLKAGEAGYDPFSRRWTRSRNYYVSKPGEDAAAGSDIADSTAAAGTGSKGTKAASVVVETGVVATAAALEAAAEAGKLVDTSAPVDQGTESNELHNFDLLISLDTLRKFGGPEGAKAGFIARKQRVEMVGGYRVPENDGKVHAMTLTVDDYIRRRGLV